jgi:hypothetical protein
MTDKSLFYMKVSEKVKASMSHAMEDAGSSAAEALV